MFRPAGIQPLHGIRSKTAWVQAIYVGAAPLLSLLNRVAPNYMTTTEQVGPRHDSRVAREGLSETGTGERGYQSALIVIPGRVRSTEPGILEVTARDSGFALQRAPE